MRSYSEINKIKKLECSILKVWDDLVKVVVYLNGNKREEVFSFLFVVY